MRMGDGTFPLTGICGISQHGNSSCPEIEQLWSWVGCSARGPGSGLYLASLHSIGAVGVTTTDESFCINYARLESEALNCMLVSLCLIFLNIGLQ